MFPLPALDTERRRDTLWSREVLAVDRSAFAFARAPLRPAAQPRACFGTLCLALFAGALGAAACAPRPTITRRPATAGERTAVVECAAAIVTDAGFTVTDRRPDLGRLSAATATEASDDPSGGTPVTNGAGDSVAPASGRATPPVDVITVTIAKHPLTAGLALLVHAATQAGDGPTQPSPKVALARDRILSGCAYLVG